MTDPVRSRGVNVKSPDHRNPIASQHCCGKLFGQRAREGHGSNTCRPTRLPLAKRDFSGLRLPTPTEQAETGEGRAQDDEARWFGDLVLAATAAAATALC